MNQAGPLDAAERAAFTAWLKASPIHVEEYLGVALVARDLRLATDDPSVSLESLLAEAQTDDGTHVVSFDQSAANIDTRPEPRRSRPARQWLLATATATAVLVGILTWWVRGPGSAGTPVAYQTARGEQGSWRLPDGSLLRLNTESAVSVRYSSRERVVEIERGQALFDVAHDDPRRFRVAAGQVGAIAVGTRFDVYREPTSTTVTIVEGRVAVFTGKPPRLANPHELPPHVQLVDAGYQLRIDGGVVQDHPIRVDVDQNLAWLQGKIAFERRPLGEVAEEFNRYAQVPIEIDDVGLRALAVSGVFEADDMESFLVFLESIEGVAVERSPTRIRVYRATTAGQQPKTIAP